MAWIFGAVFFNVLPAVVVSLEGDGNWECEAKSILWNEEIHRNLTSHCGDFKMSYNKQYCAVKNTTLLHCMVERARMHDAKSCLCHRGNIHPTLCNYDEVCAFVDPQFQCSNGYKCDVDEEGRMTCVAEGHATYINNCTRGLIYCPEHYCLISVALDLHKFYEDECRGTYQKMFGDGKIVYYVDRKHFNGSDYEYGDVNALLPPGYKDPCTNVPESSPNWILLVIVSLSVIPVLVLLLPVCVWRVRKRRAKEDERWKSIFSNTLDSLTKFMQNGANSYEMTEATEIAENVDPIVAEFPSHEDGDVRECLLDRKTNSNKPISENDTTTEDSLSTKTDNVHSSSSCDPDITQQRSLVASLSLHDNDLNDDKMSADILFPAVFDSDESVFETDERILDDHISPDSVDEATTNNHNCTMNVYENSTYGHLSISSGYIPKSFDLNQDS